MGETLGRAGALSIAMASTIGCGSGSAPTCMVALEHAFAVSSEDADDDLADMIEICVEQKWSGELRTCLSKGKNSDDLARCMDRAGPKVKDGVKSGRSEAELGLKAIEKAARAYYIENGEFPPGTIGPTPATSCCEPAGGDGRCEPDPTLWVSGDADAPSIWELLDFSIDEPHRFQYQYERDAGGIIVRAFGDLDCDGTSVTYALSGRLHDGTPFFDITLPTRPD